MLVADGWTYQGGNRRPFIQFGINNAAPIQNVGTVASAPMNAVWNDQWSYNMLYAGNDTGIIARHLEMANVLWCDGHVKASNLGNLQGSKINDGSNTYLSMFNAKQ